MSILTVYNGEALVSGESRFKGVPMSDGNVVHMLPKRAVTPKLRLWNQNTVIKYCGSEYDTEVVAGAREFGTDEELEKALSETIQYTEEQLEVLDDLNIDFATALYEIDDVPVFDKKGRIEKIEKGILTRTQIIQGNTLATWISTNPDWKTHSLFNGIYEKLADYVEITRGKMFMPNIVGHDKWVVSSDDYGAVPFLTGLDPVVAFNGGAVRKQAIDVIESRGITPTSTSTPIFPEAQIIQFPTR